MKRIYNLTKIVTFKNIWEIEWLWCLPHKTIVFSFKSCQLFDLFLHICFKLSCWRKHVILSAPILDYLFLIHLCFIVKSLKEDIIYFCVFLLSWSLTEIIKRMQILWFIWYPLLLLHMWLNLKKTDKPTVFFLFTENLKEKRERKTNVQRLQWEL